MSWRLDNVGISAPDGRRGIPDGCFSVPHKWSGVVGLLRPLHCGLGGRPDAWTSEGACCIMGQACGEHILDTFALLLRCLLPWQHASGVTCWDLGLVHWLFLAELFVWCTRAI